MSMDLILWADTKADLKQFAVNRNLFRDSVDEQGKPIKVRRRGFQYSWWAGTGKVMSVRKTLRTTRAVDIIQNGNFGFDVPALPWIGAGVTAERDGEIVGTYSRRQGPYEVFSLESEQTVKVSNKLDIYTPAKYLPGVVALCRLYDQVEANDKENTPKDDPEYKESWKRSKIAKAVKDNGVLINMANGDLTGYEWDGVRLLRYQDVEAWLTAKGLPTHTWQGGNKY